MMNDTHNNIHISGKIIVIFTMILQIVLWFKMHNQIYNWVFKILFYLLTPLFYCITSFFIFYTLNLLYNVVTPSEWIQQNSKYLSYAKRVLNYGPDVLMVPFEISKCSSTGTGTGTGTMGTCAHSACTHDHPHTELFTSYTLSNDSDIETNMYSDMYSNMYSNICPDANPNTNLQFIDCIQNPVITPEIIVTVQIPVYTENFLTVLKPTIENVVQMCRTYNNSHTSKINIFINDDGLAKLDIEERAQRINYYDSIDELFYIGRPSSNRNGKFKKASNMNFCLRQALLSKTYNDWSYLSLKNKFFCKKGDTESQNINFTLGKYILLLDSDSKINVCAINSLIEEMEFDEKIGFLQVNTSTMYVSNSRWEKIIGHFTNNIYGLNFLYSCASGFPAPLVGHNCLLRWSALLQIAHSKNFTSLDHWYVWDETRVSEDFVLSMELMTYGYYGKYVYYECGTKEGVTLNIIDEIVKLKKYMYGVNEIVFYKFNEMRTRGIFTHVFSNFLSNSNVNWSVKYAILSYICSYYTILFSPMLYLAYAIVVLSKQYYWTFLFIDQNYVIVGSVIVFYVLSVLSNVKGKCAHRYDGYDGEAGGCDKGYWVTFWHVLKNELFYGLHLTCFFGGLSYHFATITYEYFFDKNITWGATNKELNEISFMDFVETYKYLYVLCYVVIIPLVIGLLYLYNFSYELLINCIPLFISVFMHTVYPMFVFG